MAMPKVAETDRWQIDPRIRIVTVKTMNPAVDHLSSMRIRCRFIRDGSRCFALDKARSSVHVPSFGQVMSQPEEYIAVSLDGTQHTVVDDSSADVGAIEKAYDPETVDAFRSSMRTLAGGVVMITTRVGGKPWGLTISSCCSVSLEPPQLLVSLSRHTASCASILVTGKFGVSVLGTAQKELAQHGAVPRTPKFIADYCDDDDPAAEALSPMILGALCHLDCRLASVFDGGDHALLLGQVDRAVRSRHHSDAQPLLYFNGLFHSLGESLSG